MGMAPATINRELSTLIRMLGLGYEREKVARMPKIHKLTEAPPRSVFFESHDFEAVCQQLRPELQLAARIAYNFEWRMPSEVLSLTLSQVDLSAGTLRLNPGGSKTGEARTVYLTREIAALLEAQVERVPDPLTTAWGRAALPLCAFCVADSKGSASETFGKAGRMPVARWGSRACCATISDGRRCET